MERDFEREFRELKQNEIPDLWNRIEAGLSEKKNVTQVSQNVIAIDHAPGAGRGRFEKNDFEKGDTKKPFAWRRWGTLIAACVCVVIILPAFSLLIRDKSYSGSGNDAAANTTEAIAEDNAAMDTATAENAESEFAAEDAAAAEEMIPENGMADSAAAESAEGMAGGADTADAGSVGAAASTNEAAASEEKAPEASSDATMENAQIQEADGAETSRKEEEKAGWSELTDGQIWKRQLFGFRRRKQPVAKCFIRRPSNRRMRIKYWKAECRLRLCAMTIRNMIFSAGRGTKRN